MWRFSNACAPGKSKLYIRENAASISVGLSCANPGCAARSATPTRMAARATHKVPAVVGHALACPGVLVVGRTPWSAADALVGLCGAAQEVGQGADCGPGGPPH